MNLFVLFLHLVSQPDTLALDTMRMQRMDNIERNIEVLEMQQQFINNKLRKYIEDIKHEDPQ